MDELRKVLGHAGYVRKETETGVIVWQLYMPTVYTEQTHIFREVPEQNAVVLDIHGKPWHHFVEATRLRAFLVSLGIV